MNLATATALLDREFSYPPTNVSTLEAQAVVDYAAQPMEMTQPVKASEMARMLLGFYPAREVHDANVYAAGMSAMLAAFPLRFVKNVCDPVNGLPSKLKWLPTLAEVRAALDAEKAKRDRVVANAMWVLREAKEKAEKENAEREARDYHTSTTAEERALFLKNALGRFS